MKNIIIVLSLLVLIGCDKNDNSRSSQEVIENGSLEEIKNKRNEILKSYDKISKELSLLEQAIAEKDPNKKLPLVTTYTITREPFIHAIAIQGDVDTKENLLIFPEYSGILERVFVKEGQSVRKGQLLARIDDGGLSSQLAQLNTQLSLAKTTFERQERLWNQKIGSEIQYLQAKTNYEAQRNAVNQLKAQLEKTKIKAPFSGTIDQVIAEQGSVVSPGSGGLMRIVNLQNMFIRAAIPENYLGSIKKNATVQVNFPSLNKNIQGRIRQVSNYIDPNNRTFSIEIDVPNEEQDIKPNLIAKLSIVDYVNDKAIIIPSNIIQENAIGEKFVFLIKDIKDSKADVLKTKVTSGLIYNNTIEILDGLKIDDIIVKEGAITLRDGATVKIKSAE